VTQSNPHTGLLPSFTLVTPSLNQGPYLARAIESVLDQSLPPAQYFVHDAGSTDGSVAIIERYADRLSGWRSGPDGGQSAAINLGWHAASGDLLGWLNSDDYLLPGALETIARAFANYPERVLVYGQMQFVDASGAVIGTVGEPYSRRTMILSHNPIPQPAAFVRRSAIEQVGLLDEDLHYVMDYELWLRLAALGPPLFLPRLLAAATVHADTKTIKGRVHMVAERQKVRRRYARGAERALVSVQPIGSGVYQALPKQVRNAVDRLRPRRILKAPPTG
jgi:glycosyltransferase involved in cell wall biosynthesis